MCYGEVLLPLSVKGLNVGRVWIVNLSRIRNGVDFDRKRFTMVGHMARSQREVNAVREKRPFQRLGKAEWDCN